MRTYGSIAGKVVDENKNPVAAAIVYLVSKEYQAGVVCYRRGPSAISKPNGDYRFTRVELRPFLAGRSRSAVIEDLGMV